MAFCPECGKAVTPDEAACSSCGKQLRTEAKKPRAGRFHGTMMMTAPEVNQEPPANINARAPTEHAAAGGMAAPRMRAPAAATRSSPPSAKQGSNLAPNTGAATLGRPGPSPVKATMIGAGVASNTVAQKPEQKHATMIGAGVASNTVAQRPEQKHATMLGAALAPPRVATPPSSASASVAPQAKAASSNPPPQAQEIAKSERPPAVRQTIPQASTAPSVRAVQSMPVSPSADGEEPAPRPAPAAHVPAAGPALHDARTVPSPLPHRGVPRSPNPARMVQAIPEVDGSVVEASELPRYLPGDPMAPQPPAAKRALRLRERPRAPTPKVDGDGHGNYIMLYWALCVAIVAAACALAFRWF